jgi:sulfonate transport system permease protein
MSTRADKITHRLNYAGLVLPAVILLIWYLRARSLHSPLLPPPQDTLIAIKKLWVDGRLQVFFIRSMYRFFPGLFFGMGAGFVIGAVMGSFRRLSNFFMPNFHAMRIVPIVGWIPVLVVWFGIGDTPRIVIVAMAAFFPMLINTHSGFSAVPREFFEIGSIFEMNRFVRFCKIVLPAAMPSIRSGTILSFSFAWTTLVAAEILTETHGGLGNILDIGRETFHLELVNAGILILGLLGFVFDALLVRCWNIGKLRWLSVSAYRDKKI